MSAEQVRSIHPVDGIAMSEPLTAEWMQSIGAYQLMTPRMIRWRTRQNAQGTVLELYQARNGLVAVNITDGATIQISTGVTRDEVLHACEVFRIPTT